MADAVARCGEPLHLLGVEYLLEEVDQPGRSVHDQIRCDGMIFVGLGLDRHGLTPLFWVTGANLGWPGTRCKRHDRERHLRAALEASARCPCSDMVRALPSARLAIGADP